MKKYENFCCAYINFSEAIVLEPPYDTVTLTGLVGLYDITFEQAWKMVTIEHYRTCRYSSSDKILNLDHLGTNTPISNVEDYLEHTKMLLSLKDGYPCVSLLPDLFGQAATDIFVGCVKEWQEEHKK